jgi:hypothetical protein
MSDTSTIRPNFIIHDAQTDLIVVKGLVVPQNSTVFKGIEVFELPCNDSNLLKQLFGPMKNKTVINEEEEDIRERKEESSDSGEDSEDYENSESEDEQSDSDE